MVIDVKRHITYPVLCEATMPPNICTPVAHARRTLRIVHTYALYEPSFAACSPNTIHNMCNLCALG